MTAATLPFAMLWRHGWTRSADAAARTDPPVMRRPGPVFIHDVATPFRDGTLLLARLRADLAASAGVEED